MKRVFLQNNTGFKWISSDKCFVKGYLFDKSGKFYEEKSLLEYFSGINSFSDFEERVQYADGSFSIIVKKGEELFIAADRIRSLPLFYSRYKENWIVSDSPYYIAEKINLTLVNDLAGIEFLATGYVTGNETLIDGIHQVQAGEILHLKSDDLFNKFYYSYRISSPVDNPYKELVTAGKKVMENSFRRLAESIKGKTAVIPLSGGFDSRLIAAMAKLFDIGNVICFTYGRKGSSEIEVSKAVAEKLGFKWYYIEYSDDLLKNFNQTEEFYDYYRFAAGLTSMFFMQEYFAVKYLKENNLIPEDSVFIPGHSGDFLGGSQLNKHGNLNLDEDDASIVERIFEVKYCLKRPSKSNTSKIYDRIHKSLKEKFTGENAISYSVHEDWDFKEKLAKFNFNSVTTYTYFGYEFRLPFWDNEMLDFFKYLPLHVKINKYLYDEILTTYFFKPYDLNFPRELQPTETDIKKLKLKSKIKKHLPEEVKRLFVSDKDWLCYNEITGYLKKDLEKKDIRIKLYGNSYNSLITQWYYHQVKEMAAENASKKSRQSV